MKSLRRSLTLALAAAVLASTAAAAVPEGSFRGSSPLLAGPDVMALLIRPDPADDRAGYAILAEYTRVPYIPGPERIEITRWVPRLYAYRVEQIDGRRYAMKPLRVSVGGGIEVDPGYANLGQLTLAREGTVVGAVMTRYDRGSVMIAETIAFDGKVSSTWEDYVPGNYFGSKDSTGSDYLRKDVNTVLGEDKVAEFNQREIVGAFAVAEKAPGMFVFTPKGVVAAGADKVVTRIGVFVDIVNWKPFMTTDELLLINPDDAKDVGFYYERH